MPGANSNLISLLPCLALAAFLSACASPAGPNYGSETPWLDDKSAADSAVYGPSAMTFSKRAQPRRPATSTRFFFKDCAPDDGRSYYSKTAYVCSEALP